MQKHIHSRHSLLALSAALWLTAGLAAEPSASFGVSLPSIAAGSRLPQAQVFNGFGCQGGNVSPAIQWHDAPLGTRSFAVTLYDPDAPTGSGWWHWLVYNIPVTVTALSEHAGDAGGKLLPAGAVQGRTDFGTTGFGGACPPVGDKPHRYIFTVYALKIERIDLPADASSAMIGAMLNGHQLGRVSVTARYSR